jgi:DNA (cytosine-5)-methyltransferase 1
VSRPKLLDLFCCAGGASTGYDRAGFDVYGIDIMSSPRYPFPFFRGDAIEALNLLLKGQQIPFTGAMSKTSDFLDRVEWLGLDDFTAIAASPPCQAYSITRHTNDKEHPDLVAPTRELLIETGKPYVIENVEGAPLVDALLLCGSMFGLKAIDVDGERLSLRRHRLFESNIWLMSAGGCVHDSDQVAGVYGGGRHRNISDRDNPSRRGGYTPLGSVRNDLMGIDWMNQWELTQAIPPAYTEFIGAQLLAAIEVAA